jgi:hypothetical protein
MRDLAFYVEELGKSLVGRTDRLASDISYLNEAVQRLRDYIMVLRLFILLWCIVNIGAVIIGLVLYYMHA